MLVLNEDCSAVEMERSDRNFIRIQNLPWTACRTDIRKFFCGLSVKKGGILVRNFEAFVAFENDSDARLALHRRNILLHGFKLKLSVVDRNQLRKALSCIVRRKLNFESNLEMVDTMELDFRAPPKRKIRPTPVLKGDKRWTVSHSAFLTEESSASPSSFEAGANNPASVRGRKRFFNGVRKVHPTSVIDASDVGSFQVFHPEECFEYKRMKLEV